MRCAIDRCDARVMTDARVRVRARRLPVDVVVESVRRSLAGHDDLLDGFRAFLPKVRLPIDGDDDDDDDGDGDEDDGDGDEDARPRRRANATEDARLTRDDRSIGRRDDDAGVRRRRGRGTRRAGESRRGATRGRRERETNQGGGTRDSHRGASRVDDDDDDDDDRSSARVEPCVNAKRRRGLEGVGDES